MFKLKKKLRKFKPHSPGLMTLYDAVPGKRYRILRVEGGCKLNSRLCAMGLMPGEVFNVYAYSRGGPVCISVKGSRFAIGRGMMGRVFIGEA
jgi:ferrous iron transport protein A